ncbi:MAG: tetratricopeptide repeat protein, partial [Bacteroidota bacterium]
MKKMWKAALLAVGIPFVFFGSNAVYAQPEETIYLRMSGTVDTLFYEFGDRHLEAGKSMGLQMGQEVEVYAIHQNWDRKSEDMRLGKGTISELWDSTAMVQVEFEMDDWADRNLEGPFVVPFQIPRREDSRRSLFYEMGLQGIIFNDVHGGLLLAPKRMLAADAHQHTEKWAQKMVKEVHYVATELRENVEKHKLSGGPYDGVNLYEAMMDANVLNVKSFLAYMALRPRKYRGTAWKFSEIYATWLDSEAPTSIPFAKEQILAMDKATRLEKGVKMMGEDRWAQVLEEWQDEAKELQDNGFPMAALDMVNASIDIAEKIAHPLRTAWGYYVKGQILQDQEQYRKGMEAFEVSIAKFQAMESKVGEAFVRYNLGTVHLRSGQYAQALKDLKKAIDMQEPIIEKDPESMLRGVHGLTWINYGETHFELGKKKKA